MYGPANSGDIPIVGDWNANGTDTVGLYDPKTSTFYLRNSNTSGMADVTFVYGTANAGLVPSPATGTGRQGHDCSVQPDDVDVFPAEQQYQRHGQRHLHVRRGQQPWIPWSATGMETARTALGSTTRRLGLLPENTNEGGYADVVFMYGTPNSGSMPITGDWMGDAKSLMAAEPVVAAARRTHLDASPTGADRPRSACPVGQRRFECGRRRETPAGAVRGDRSAGAQLGEEAGNVIYLDANAAGEGWFVDPTPAQNEGFRLGRQSAVARHRPAALDRIDLLTVVEHE